MTQVRAVRETFASRFGTLMTMIGVAVGLGNVWRFPYMVGKFGGAAFVLFYVLVVVVIGIPALMAEFALGRHTQRGLWRRRFCLHAMSLVHIIVLLKCTATFPGNMPDRSSIILIA